MSISCTPASLADAAKTFQGLPSEQKQWIDTYLLAVIAGGSTDPNTLSLAAKCFQCIPPGMIKRVQAYLLCQIVSGGGGGSVQDMQLEWTPSSIELGSSGFINSSFGDSTGLKTLTFTGTSYTGNLNIISSPALTSVSFPNATSLGQVAFNSCAVLGTFSVPLVQSADSITVTSSNALAAFSAPALTSGDITLYSNPDLASVSLPSLITSSIDIENTIITALNLGSLVTSSGAFVDSNALLTTLVLPHYVPTNGLDQAWTNNALNQASVDLVLHRCVLNAAYVSGTVDLTGGTNATPSVTGLADKATLIGRGCAVNTN